MESNWIKRYVNVKNLIFFLSIVMFFWLSYYFYTGFGGPMELAAHLVPVALLLQILFMHQNGPMYKRLSPTVNRILVMIYVGVCLYVFYHFHVEYEQISIYRQGSYTREDFVMGLLVFLLVMELSRLAHPPSGNMFSTPITFTTSLLAVLIVGLVMPRIYGSVLKKERIEDEGLLSSIRGLSAKMGIGSKFAGAYRVPVKGFKVVNAAQLGFSRRQARIYLIGDVEKVLDRKEMEAVIAHEFAHLKMRHILKLSLVLLSLMLGLYVSFSFLTELLVYYLVGSGLVLTAEVSLLILLVADYLAPLTVLYLLLLKFRRMFEIEADVLAARITSPKDLATSLSKLADYNLVPMKFPKIIGIMKGHPSISERIDRLEHLM